MKIENKDLELIVKGKLIIPFESEGFLVDGEWVGEIFRHRFGEDPVDEIEIYIRKGSK